MSEKIQPIESFADDDWQKFIGLCRERVEADKAFGINSKFMFNPEICPNPKYLLLGMEPADPKEHKVNFFPLWLHYCAWKELCEGNIENDGFKYYFTDLSKGGMLTSTADINRRERYSEWLKLFDIEWELLKRPKVIVIGKTLFDNRIRNKAKCGTRDYLYHYTKDRKRRQELYNEFAAIKKSGINLVIPEKKDFEDELKIFKEKLKTHLIANTKIPELIPEYEFHMEDSFEKTLKLYDHYGIVFTLYSYCFKQFKNGNNPHPKS